MGIGLCLLRKLFQRMFYSFVHRIYFRLDIKSSTTFPDPNSWTKKPNNKKLSQRENCCSRYKNKLEEPIMDEEVFKSKWEVEEKLIETKDSKSSLWR